MRPLMDLTGSLPGPFGADDAPFRFIGAARRRGTAVVTTVHAAYDDQTG